jgi:hypothetical protein
MHTVTLLSPEVESSSVRLEMPRSLEFKQPP